MSKIWSLYAIGKLEIRMGWEEVKYSKSTKQIFPYSRHIHVFWLQPFVSVRSENGEEFFRGQSTSSSMESKCRHYVLKWTLKSLWKSKYFVWRLWCLLDKEPLWLSLPLRAHRFNCNIFRWESPNIKGPGSSVFIFCCFCWHLVMEFGLH